MVEGFSSFHPASKAPRNPRPNVENQWGKPDCKLKGVTHAPAFRVHSAAQERLATRRPRVAHPCPDKARRDRESPLFPAGSRPASACSGTARGLRLLRFEASTTGLSAVRVVLLLTLVPSV